MTWLRRLTALLMLAAVALLAPAHLSAQGTRPAARAEDRKSVV